MVVGTASTPVPLHHQTAAALAAPPVKRLPNPNPTLKPAVVPTPTPKASQMIPVGPTKPAVVAVAPVPVAIPVAKPGVVAAAKAAIAALLSPAAFTQTSARNNFGKCFLMTAG